MGVTRRTFIKNSCAAGVATGIVTGAMPSMLAPVWAKSSTKLGNIQIDVLSDGNLRLPVRFIMGNAPEDEVKAFFAKHQMPTDFIEPACNLTLVRDGERTILFDVGAGPNFMPSAGKILEAMEAIELDPSEVTHVLFTHAHPDHLWGLLDDFDELVFPDAQYMISKQEWDYWVDPETVNKIGEARQSFAAGAKRNLAVIEDQVTRFDMESEVLPGIRAINTIGHTPGHVAYEIRSGSESLVVVGDALTNALFSFEKPHWEIGSDQDPQMGAKSRARLLDQLANDKMQMIGYHIPYPGIGRVEKTAEAYRFVAG